MRTYTMLYRQYVLVRDRSKLVQYSENAVAHFAVNLYVLLTMPKIKRRGYDSKTTLYNISFVITGLPTDSSMIGQPILVCTAHIHWDPEFCDVKLIQTMMLSNELRTILDDSGRTLRLAGQRDNVQLLLCGDFNSLPDSGTFDYGFIYSMIIG